MDHRIDAVGRQRPVRQSSERVNPHVHPVGQPLANDVEGQVEGQQHHCQKGGDGGVPAGEDPVDLHRAGVFPALMALHHGGAHHIFNKAVPHIRQCGVAVQTGLCLHLDDAVLQKFLFVFIQLQLVRQIVAALDELGGAEPGGNAYTVGMVRDEVHHGVNTAVYGRVVRTEVRHLGQDLSAGHSQRLIHQFADALALGRRDGDYGDPQRLTHFPHVDGAAVGPDLIHHVQGQHHGHPQLQKLKGQIQVPLDVGGVHNIDDAVGLLIDDEVPRNDLLLRIGPQGIDTRQVHNGTALFIPDLAHFLIHGNAGEVAHVLIGAGEGVEQRGLAAVLIAYQRKNHQGSSFTSIFSASSTRRVSS